MPNSKNAKMTKYEKAKAKVKSLEKKCMIEKRKHNLEQNGVYFPV